MAAIKLALLIVLLFASQADAMMLIAGKPPAASAPAPISISDDFSSDTSANYSTLSTDSLVVSAGTAIPSGNTYTGYEEVYHTTSLGSPNQTVTGIIGKASDGSSSGLVLRCDGTQGTPTGYIVYPNFASGTAFYLAKLNSATSPTYISTWTTAETWSVGTYHKIKAVISGTTISLWIDWNDDGDFLDAGESEGDKTDSSFSTGNYVGIYWRANGSYVYVDNFTGDPL